MIKTHKIVIDDKISIMLRPKSKAYEVYAIADKEPLLIQTFKTSLQDAIDYALNLIEKK